MNPALIPALVILALTTLLLVVNEGSPFLVAITACGVGVLTCLLGQDILRRRGVQ